MITTHPAPARTRVAVLVHVVLRASGILAVDQGYQLAIQHAPAGSGLDDPLGAGLVGFAVLALAAGAWGLLDGWFLDHGRLALVWGIAAPSYAVVSVVIGDLAHDGPHPSLLVGDLLSLVPVLTTILVVPALLTALGPWALSPRRR